MSSGFTSSIFNAFNSNVPPAIANMGSASIEGPVGLRPPSPATAAVPGGASLLGSGPNSPQSQSQMGAKQLPGAPLNPSAYASQPIMMRTSPKRIKSQVKTGLPSIGSLYRPTLPSKKGSK
jgi:hypothetical protein